MPHKCIILSGGEFHPVEKPGPGDFLIACDRGYEYAQRCGVMPDLVVGDFDSCGEIIAEGVPVKRLPVEKDDTDTMSAIRFACAQGFDEIELQCALGGRLDHTLANLQSLVFAEKHGLRASVISPDTVIRTLHCGSLRLPRQPGFSLSVFAAEDLCRGVSIHGTKYELEREDLSSAFPLGVSNEWRADEAEISVEDGILLIVLSRL